MTIARDLLGPGTFREEKTVTKGMNVIGLKSDFLNASDAKAAEDWEKVRPSLDNNGQWITANPVYKSGNTYSFSLLDDSGKTYHIKARLQKLERPSLPFPEAPVREGTVEFNVHGYGVAYYGHSLRLSTKDVFGEKDPDLLSADGIREHLTDVVMQNLEFIEEARQTAQRSGEEHKRMMKREYY